MRIGMLGNGTLATALGRAWVSAGHVVVFTGRDSARARDATALAGGDAVEPDGLAECDVVVVAIAWDGLDDATNLAGGPTGQLAGKTVVDCTNAVDFTTGRLQLNTGSAAERVAALSPGAHVVKGLHLMPAASWPVGDEADAPVVPLCGDDPGALERASTLVRDLGGVPVVVGDLRASRQAEEVAGFVMRLVRAGANPRSAVPRLG